MIVTLCLVQGEDFEYSFDSVDADDSYTVSGFLDIVDEFDQNIGSATIDSDGVITISMTASETVELQTRVVYYYRIRLESMSGIVSFPYEGVLQVTPTFIRV